MRRSHQTAGTGRPRLFVTAAALAVLAALAVTVVGAGAARNGDQYTLKLKSGKTFSLASSIRAKIAAHKPLNYVFSYGSCSIQGFSQQYQAGYDASIPAASKIYPINGKRLCPPQTQQDVNTQINQIQALLNTNQVDCLSIEPQGSTSMAPLVAQTLAKGIPTFTVGLSTFGDELTNFTQVPNKEGHTAAATVLSYMKANNLHFTTFAVSGGDPTQYWAQQRALGFRQGIQAAIPGAKFVTTEKNMLNTTYDPGKTYDAFKAFLSGAGKNVQVIENVDIGAGFAAQAIKDAGLQGKAFSVGWNVIPNEIAAIKNGTQIALFDQDWPQQAAFGAFACAEFAKSGKVLPNTQHLTVVTKANLSTALSALNNFKHYALQGLPG
ncbi:MAG: sugar ABC transporter substrate-binding protein [Actinobacteria bacterium]|nr:sugar ABC transporter substrate-binding protein [Actinomycetota bacterium]MBV8397046.1 sugar ABC transporter substrate-binding protein [Actinomycetota bacterium]